MGNSYIRVSEKKQKGTAVLRICHVHAAAKMNKHNTKKN
jgi:hypothetical protein